MKFILAIVAFAAGLGFLLKGFAERDHGHVLLFVVFSLFCSAFCFAGWRLLAVYNRES